jgi:hypothetical protein
MRKNIRLRKKRRSFATTSTSVKRHNQSSGCPHSLELNWWWLTKKTLGFILLCADPTFFSSVLYSWSLFKGLVGNRYKGKIYLKSEIKSAFQLLNQEYLSDKLLDIQSVVMYFFS